MKILITAGPTREYIDPVRYITNGSSGRMGVAVAEAARAAGCQVTLLLGPVAIAEPTGVTVRRFTSVADLQALLAEEFPRCDVLVMAAAVGDFTVADRSEVKIRRAHGPVTLELIPTPDLLAGVAAERRAGQILIGFAVADVDPDAVAREKLLGKNLDYVVVNPPAAMNAPASRAAIVSHDGYALTWADRPKEELAKAIVELFNM